MRQSIATALLALALMTGAALAQQRTTYDARGNLVGRSATDSQGTTDELRFQRQRHQPRVRPAATRRRCTMRAGASYVGDSELPRPELRQYKTGQRTHYRKRLWQADPWRRAKYQNCTREYRHRQTTTRRVDSGINARIAMVALGVLTTTLWSFAKNSNRHTLNRTLTPLNCRKLTEKCLASLCFRFYGERQSVKGHR